MDHELTGSSSPRASAAPTPASLRLSTVDTIRGFALLGILFMNMASFGLPEACYMNPTVAVPTAGLEFTGLNKLVWMANYVIFDTKMMSLFSLLFGAGVVLFYEKTNRGAKLSDVRDAWLSRTGWLLLIGLCHAIFLWYGDVLVPYAVCGLAVLWWARRLPPLWLYILGALAMLWCAAGLLGVGYYMGTIADDQRVAAWGVPAEQLAQMRQSLEMFAPTPEQLEKTIATHQGPYVGMLIHRVPTLMFSYVFFALVFGWRILGMMLVGVALMKSRVLTGERSTRFYAIFTAVFLGLGLPLVLAGLGVGEATSWDLFWLMTGTMPLNNLGSIFMALGYAGLVILLVKLNVLGLIGRALEAVGRMAFTNYLTHTVVCTTIFYGYGLGRFATMDRVELLLVTLGICVAQLIISPLWLARFRFGPLEWAWRSLTYLKPQPMRRSASAEAPTA